jgi:WD40 repeat protein
MGVDPGRVGPLIASAVLESAEAPSTPHLAEHWFRAVRGAPTGTQFLFTGRATVLADVAAFATRTRPGLCVVTGMPGAGKSAVLGALVIRGMAADLLTDRLHDHIPDIHPSAAVHASDRSAAEVVREIAHALEVPGSVDPRRALIEHLDRRIDHPPLIIVDAVDEANTDVLPLLVDLARVTRLILGVRSGSGGVIPAVLGALYPQLIDLDDKFYHSEEDVAAYVAQRLAGDDRVDGYGRTDRWPRRLLVDVIGREVGRAARRNFLVAQLMTEELLDRPPLTDVTGRWSEQLRWPGRVEEWMRRDLDRRLTGEQSHLRTLLRPLAFAYRGGLPPDIWRAAAGRFRGGPAMSLDEQADVLEVLGFFVAVAGDRRRRFSLRHQAFVSYFRSGPSAEDYAAAMTASVLDAVPVLDGRRQWQGAPDYVRGSVLSHLAESGDLDSLIVDEPACLAAVVVDSAGEPLAEALTTAARQAAGVFGRASYTAAAGFGERAAALQFQARLARVDWMADVLAATAGALPWATVWRTGGPPAAVPLGTPLTTWQIAAVSTPDGRPALATVGVDGLCVVLDAATQSPIGPRFRISPTDDAPSTVVAWNGAGNDVFIAAVNDIDNAATIRVWQASGPHAATDPVLAVSSPPPVQHVIPLRGPGGVDLLWIAAGRPLQVTLWAVGKQAGDPAPLVDAEPFDAAFAVGVGDGVVTGTRAGEIRLWTYRDDARTSAEILTAPGQELWRLLAAGPSSELCLVADRDHTLETRWWPHPSRGGAAGGEHELGSGGKLVRAALAGTGPVRRLVTGDSGGTVHVWQLTRDEPPDLRASFTVDGTIREVALLGAGDLVAAATWDGRVRAHTVAESPEPSTGARPVALLSPGEPLSHLLGLGRNAEGHLLATRSLGGLTKLWQVGTLAEPTAEGTSETNDPVRLLTATPCDSTADLLVAAAETRYALDVRILSLDGSTPLPVRLQREEETFALAAGPLPSGGAVVCAAGDEHLTAWTLRRNGEPLRAWRTSVADEPTEHLLVLIRDRSHPVLAYGGPEGLHIAALVQDAIEPAPVLHLADVGISTLTASRGAADLLTVGTEDGLLYAVTDHGDGVWQAATADHGEAITHAFAIAHQDRAVVLLTIGRSGSVRLWDVADGSITARGGFQNLTEITHAAPLTVGGRRLVAWIDLTGALQILDVLSGAEPHLITRVPPIAGRASRLVVGHDRHDRPTVAVASSSGRLLLASPDTGRHVVADLNCDLAALTYTPRCGWFVGAYGAALFAIENGATPPVWPPSV